jgi:NAD+ synthase (glutamine-hydrolysing)
VFSARLHDTRRRQTQFRILGVETTEGRAVPTPLAAPCEMDRPRVRPSVAPLPTEMEEIYGALVLGTRDYVRKTGHHTITLGLSGGIDSSLVAAIAVNALGAENVVGVLMPSRYSSGGSLTDAECLAENLGIRTMTIPIEEVFASYLSILADPFEGREPDIAEENLQARIRGNILMALTNKFGWMVLTTGNKSEMAVGYSTLYGDLAGGYAVIKDIFKTTVYDLAYYKNQSAGREVIPRSVIEKEPSAELRSNQRDVDSLPPYPVLDGILRLYVELDRSASDIVAHGYEADMVARVIKMVDRSEYKRRQAPPGVKISTRAFGKDRRLPIVNSYRDLPEVPKADSRSLAPGKA